jgi:hypothetical protein
MSILNPIVSKFTLTLDVPQEIYICPPGKSHAIVDVSFLKDTFVGSSIISIALTTQSNPAALTTVDYFVDDIELVDDVNSAELNKVIVGAGERLFVMVVQGGDINVRLSGVEENNPKVVKAGKLVGTRLAGTSQTQIFQNVLPSVAYVSTSLTVYNSNPTLTAEIEIWVSTLATPNNADKVVRFKVTAEDTTIIENMLLLPTERVFVRSNQVNTEYFMVGMIVGT